MLKIVSTAKDFDKTLLDFENVGRGGHMDCKSNIVSTANKEQEKWVFPIGEEKQKNKKQKKNKQQTSEWRRNSSLFTPKPIDKQGESEIRTWILE